jgi:hypothetical protein
MTAVGGHVRWKITEALPSTLDIFLEDKHDISLRLVRPYGVIICFWVIRTVAIAIPLDVYQPSDIANHQT